MNVMKQILPCLLLLAGLPVAAQRLTTLKINITTDFSRRHHVSSLKPDSIKFYKMPGNKPAFTVSAEKIRESFELSSVPVGTYRVKYRNMFMGSTTREFTLIKKPLNEISLCVDSLDSYPQHSLARLQDKDSIVINFHAASCEGVDTAKLIITRDKDHFVAWMYRSFFNRMTLLREGGPVTTSLVRSVTLTDRQIQAFVRFENELLQIKPFIEPSYEENGVIIIRERISTTNESYAVKSNYFSIEKTDRWCQWNGFKWLAAAFFGRSY